MNVFTYFFIKHICIMLFCIVNSKQKMLLNIVNFDNLNNGGILAIFAYFFIKHICIMLFCIVNSKQKMLLNIVNFDNLNNGGILAILKKLQIRPNPTT